MNDLRIDLGCGSKKKVGTIGVDMQAAPGVDHVVNFEKDPLPFPDQSVAYVHLSHCLEHIVDPVRLFAEITRVCQDGARVDIWGPYAWENSAFIFDHKNFFNEDHFYHPCIWFPDFWGHILKARWLLHGFTYVMTYDTLRDLAAQGHSAYYAIRYLKGVVKEFCAHVEVRRGNAPTPPPLRRYIAAARGEPRYCIEWLADRTERRPVPADRLLRKLGGRPVPPKDNLDGDTVT
jgi:SAM-dependent methyltransferase